MASGLTTRRHALSESARLRRIERQEIGTGNRGCDLAPQHRSVHDGRPVVDAVVHARVDDLVHDVVGGVEVARVDLPRGVGAEDREVDVRVVDDEALAVLRGSRWPMRRTSAISPTRCLISVSEVFRIGDRRGKARLS